MPLGLKVFFLASGILAAPALAEEGIEVTGLTAASLDAFYGICLSEGFTLDRAVPFLEGSGFQVLDEGMMAMFAPQAPQSYMKGWVAEIPPADGQGQPLKAFLILSRAVDRDRETEACAIFFRYVDPFEFEKALVYETSAKEVDIIGQPGQVFRTFSIPEFPDILVTLMYNPRPGSVDVVAATLHLNQPPFAGP